MVVPEGTWMAAVAVQTATEEVPGVAGEAVGAVKGTEASSNSSIRSTGDVSGGGDGSGTNRKKKKKRAKQMGRQKRKNKAKGEHISGLAEPPGSSVP